MISFHVHFWVQILKDTIGFNLAAMAHVQVGCLRNLVHVEHFRDSRLHTWIQLGDYDIRESICTKLQPETASSSV